MLRTTLTWIFAGLLLMSAAPAVAGPDEAREHAKKEARDARKAARVDARKADRAKLAKAMRRTSRALRAGRTVVRAGGEGGAALRRSVHHQRAARRARAAGRPRVALHLTRLARAEALVAIRKNKGAKVPNGLTPDDEVEIAGAVDKDAAARFLRDAEADLPDEAAIIADETLGADDPE